LFDIDFVLGEINTVGGTPYGHRVIGNLGGGEFSGERLRGKVLPSGGDWGLFLPDGTLAVDGRCCFQTDDNVLIYAVYTGRWCIEPDLMAKMVDPVASEQVDPSEYYLRINFLFETAAEKYHWLNRIIAVASGRKTAAGISYRVEEIL
jgi:hypothetical protein